MLDSDNSIHPLFAGAPSTTVRCANVLFEIREAIEQYGMIERDARWLVCLSEVKTVILCWPSFMN